MFRRCNRFLAAGLTVAALAAGSWQADAATGDTLRVVAERVNLRAGPTDNANVRSQVTQGERLLELRREGSWYGVRVLSTGEEGWIFGDLIAPESSSTLSASEAGATVAGFEELSRDFDRLVGHLGQRYGFRLVERVAQSGNDSLDVTLSPQWLRAGSADEHLLMATAIYQMWKNHQNSAPVRVSVLEPGGERYITIDDREPDGNLLTLPGS
jgi:uncharacterized protein YgiM (DUF1202 family)